MSEGPAMSGAARRVATLRQFISHVREEVGVEIGFVLWDGSTVPADLAPNAFAIKFADEGVVAGLLRSPRIETLAHLWVAKRIDLVNGTLFDLAHVRKTTPTKQFRKKIKKSLALRALLPFLFVSSGGPWPLTELASDKSASGDPAENKSNVHYHYDVSNKFYELFLDKEMVYTCAYCKEWDNDLEQIQQDKLELVCRKLRLKPGERMLDIGCGWGTLAINAATHYGVHCHGVTLAEEQVAYAQAKAKRLGIEDKVKFELKDYSLIEGEGLYDKIAAIGIHEHIGYKNYRQYFETVKRLLKRDGLFLNHHITWPGRAKIAKFRRRRAAGALFNKYIFPGGDLDNVGHAANELEKYGYEVHDIENRREHYQRTCKLWHDRLLANYGAGVAEVGETTTRMWLAYLGFSSIMFERNIFNLHQTLASRRRRGPSGLPPTRADLYR